MARSKQDSLFALPFVHAKAGAAYARVNYLDGKSGKWKSKERRVDSVEQAMAAYQELRQQVGTPPANYNPEKITVAELLAEFKKAKPQMPEWYSKPIEEHFGQRRLKTITYGDLKEFKEKRESFPTQSQASPESPRRSTASWRRCARSCFTRSAMNGWRGTLLQRGRR